MKKIFLFSFVFLLFNYLTIQLFNQLCYAAEPTVTIDSVVGSSDTITINYTTSDVDGDTVTTFGWQYSLDNVEWFDIEDAQIGNNLYKFPGASYITWCSTAGVNNLDEIGDNSIWFRMKAADYSISDGTWTTGTSMPTARLHLACAAVNGKIYAIGGYSSEGYYLSPVKEYNPETDSWATKASIPTARSGLTCAAVNGEIYAIGGYYNGSWLSTVEKYDPQTDSWVTKASMPTERDGLTCAAVNGEIYAIGGSGGNKLSTVEEYDPETDSWATKASMPTARTSLTCVAVNGEIYAIGGDNGSNALSTVEEYDPGTNTWVAKTSMPTARSNLTCAAVNGKIYAIGGYDGDEISTVEEYDPQTDSWTTKTSMPTARYGSTCAAVNGKIYIISGYGNSSYLSTNEEVHFGLSSDYTTPSCFAIDNNDPPLIISITTPSGEQSGDVAISYILSDPDNSILSIFCEYSDNGGADWSTATVCDSTSAITPSKYSGSVGWQSEVDIYASSATVKFRITPSDPYDTGTSSSTAEFLVSNIHTPSFNFISITDNLDEPSGTIWVDYTASDPDGSNICTTAWQFSRDNETWYDIDLEAISDNSLKPPGASYIWWDTQTGTNNLDGIDDGTIWFRMKVTDGSFFSSAKTIGPFAIDNNDRPAATIDNIPTEITESTTTISYHLSDTENDILSIFCEYSENGGIDWLVPTISGSTSNITSDNYSGYVIWHSSSDIADGTDNDNIYFRITASDNDVGMPYSTGPIHVDYNDVPSVTVDDIYATVSDTWTINYALADPEDDTLSFVCEYSTNAGVNWNAATVEGSTSGITSEKYSGSILWYSNLDEPDISIASTRFKITPWDNDPGNADETINFQLTNVSTNPTLQIDRVEGEIGILTIYYTASVDEAGETVITSDWEFNRENSTSTWLPIDDSAISDNSGVLESGSWAICWDTKKGTNNLAWINDESVWFKMKGKSLHSGKTSEYQVYGPFKIDNGPHPPTLTIDSVVGSSGTITINYTVYDVDGDSATTYGWQYSTGSASGSWSDIVEDAIGNNVYKSPGPSYITWNSSEALAGAYDDSVWFRMKVKDGELPVIASYNSPYSHPSGLAWDGTNIWSCDAHSDKIYKHNMDETLSVAATYNSPSAGSSAGPDGLAWDGTNIWSCAYNSDKIYKHNMDATLSVAKTYNSPYSAPRALTCDGTNLWSSDRNSDKIYKHNMDETLSVAATYNSPSSDPTGLAWDGTNLWSCDWSVSRINRIYKHNMDETLSVAATYNSPSSHSYGLAWDGNNLWSCDSYPAEKIYKHRVGLSSDYSLSPSFLINNAGKPPIIHTPCTGAIEGIDFYFIAEIGRLLSSLTLYYRVSQGAIYSSVAMASLNGAIYQAIIPACQITTDYFDYYIEGIGVDEEKYTLPEIDPDVHPFHVAVSPVVEQSVVASTDTVINLADGTEIEIPVGALLQETSVQIGKPKSEEVPSPSEGLDDTHIAVREIKLATTVSPSKNYTLTLHYTDEECQGKDESKFRIYSWDGNRWKYEGGTVDVVRNLVTAEVGHFSLFSVIGDYTKPTISDVKPAEGEYAYIHLQVSARIEDLGSGIDRDSFRVQIDSDTYDISASGLSLENGMLGFISPKVLDEGEHTLCIKISDRAGNKSILTSKFEATSKSLIEFYNYPNPFPPENGTHFFYRLSAQADEVKIRIYNINGNLMKILDGTTDAGENDVFWDGKGFSGESVLSNVYICQIDISGGSQRVKKILKIVGW